MVQKKTKNPKIECPEAQLAMQALNQIDTHLPYSSSGMQYLAKLTGESPGAYTSWEAVEGPELGSAKQCQRSMQAPSNGPHKQLGTEYRCQSCCGIIRAVILQDVSINLSHVWTCHWFRAARSSSHEQQLLNLKDLYAETGRTLSHAQICC